MTAEVSRGEFDLLREMVTAGTSRMEGIDQHGTRGVAVIQEQVTELIKDLTTMKVENSAWQAGHAEEHKQEKRDKITGRRWLIGIGIAALGSLGGVYAFLYQILQQTH